ncbi:uncharacterized protein LOC130710742 [Lotus japonicus]|uniref:uncharacterized protein LOC130710742 n=1 Tax=Lotus japonicus TaxID=34305 RepID=UPI00258C0D70|nr:uncharacterized protein LOC130710742 [Lotus japonicus]
MAFRPTMSTWIAMLNGFRGGKAAYTTSTVPKMKAYAPTTDYHHHRQPGKSSGKKDFVPVYVAVGLIAMASAFGLHTAWQQLRNSPGVRVKKQRRETLPEVVEPDHVAGEADKFLKQSFFRKIAHVQERSYPDHNQMPDPTRKDAYAYEPRVETLKSVGVDPSHV